MKLLKKSLISLLALITACGMMAGAAFAEEAPEEVAPEAQAEETVQAEETAEADPVLGSWVLYEVYEVKENEEPVLLKKEENQSLYGSGIGIYTFDEDGAAHHNMIEAGDNVDKEAIWAVSEPDVYSITEDADTMTLKYDKEKDVLHRTFEDENRTLDFVYARAFIGSWKLDRVAEIHEGDAAVDLPKEENQSLYAEAENTLTFTPDGKANNEIVDGADKTVVEGSWKLTAPDKITYTEETLEQEFNYFRADDTIYRDLIDETPDAAHPHLAFIYSRVYPEPKEEETTTAAQAETKSQEASKPKRTGFSMNLIAEEGGDAVTIFELEDFSYEDDYGVTYTEEGGGGDHWYGSDGRVWIVEGAYEDYEHTDGQIFTGFEQPLYDPDTGEQVILKELTQGGYANEATGVIYHQEGGGGDHWYGEDGSVLISEWLYNQNEEGQVDDVDDTVEVEDVVEDEDAE